MLDYITAAQKDFFIIKNHKHYTVFLKQIVPETTTKYFYTVIQSQGSVEIIKRVRTKKRKNYFGEKWI